MAEINFPYTAIQLTGLVNKIPNLYGLLNELNVFPTAGSMSTLVAIPRENGLLGVLPMRERGGPASVAKRLPGDTLYFEIPHFPHMDFIDPADLQNIVQIEGSGVVAPATLQTETAKRLLAIRNKHAITREYIRMGALKGLIVDGEGTTIYDLFTSFNLTKKIIYFDLDDPAADIQAACNELFQWIAQHLLGEVMSHVEVIVDSTFFSKLVQHPKVEKFWVNWQAASQLAQQQRVAVGGQMGRVFTFQNITFREYVGVAPVIVNGTPTSVPFVAEGKGHARPVGTMDTFKTYDAPPHDIRFVNQPGQEIFISPKILDHGAGVELKTQSNPLAICRRPEVLVEVDAGEAP